MENQIQVFVLEEFTLRLTKGRGRPYHPLNTALARYFLYGLTTFHDHFAGDKMRNGI